MALWPKPSVVLRGMSSGTNHVPLTVMRTQMFIDGQWRSAASGKALEVINPATEESSPLLLLRTGQTSMMR